MSFDLVNSLFALLIVAILAGTVVLYRAAPTNPDFTSLRCWIVDIA